MTSLEAEPNMRYASTEQQSTWKISKQHNHIIESPKRKKT